MKRNAVHPQGLLSAEDWQALRHFFELLIEIDTKEKVTKYEPSQADDPIS